MKKSLLLIALVSICLIIKGQTPESNQSVSSDLATVQISLQLSSGITDMGTTVSYFKNGVYHNEVLAKGVMSHFFSIDKNRGIQISFLIDGGNKLIATGPNSSGEIETQEIEYATPCTNGLSYYIVEDYTNLTFSFGN